MKKTYDSIFGSRNHRFFHDRCFAEPAHKGADTGTNDGGQLTADFRRSPGDVVKDLYRQTAPFLIKKITLRNNAVYTPFVITPSAKKMAGKEKLSSRKRRDAACGTASHRF